MRSCARGACFFITSAFFQTKCRLLIRKNFCIKSTHPPCIPPSREKGGQRFFAWEYLTAAAAAFSFKSRNLSEPLLGEIRERVINFCARKVAFRSAPQFAAHAAYAKRCSGARYNCCHCAPQENRTQSRRRTLGFPFPHDFYQLPQPLAKKICFAKIFCEEEERAFSAYCPALPNSRVIRSVPTTSVRKETCEQFMRPSPFPRPRCRVFCPRARGWDAPCPGYGSPARGARSPSR